MKKICKQLVASMLCLLIVCMLCPVCFAAKIYTNHDLQVIMEDVVSWKKRSVGTKDSLFHSDFISGAGSSAVDWYAVALGRIGCEKDYSAYLALLKANVEARYRTPGRLDAQKATEWHRIALAVLAAGGDPTCFGSDTNGNAINLIADGIYDRSETASLSSQGINAYIWGLITLDANRYETSENGSVTREDMLAAILTNQLEDGGFSLDGKTADIDITAMALQALAPYTADDTVQSSVDKAIRLLSDRQNENGDYSAWGQGNLESTAQVMIALCSLGIDPENDNRFIKDGNSVLDGLMQYHTEEGGFAYSLENDPDQSGKANSMAGEQALCALCALYRYRCGLRTLYDLRPETDAQKEGSVYNIFDGGIPITGCIFSEKDLREYEALPETLTGEQYTVVVRLYTKLAEAENREAYESILSELTRKKEAVEAIRAEIESIDTEISAKLCPLENISAKDKTTVQTLLGRVKKLSEYDQRQITGLEDLYRAKAQIDSSTRAIWICAAVACALCVFIILFALRIRRRKKSGRDKTNFSQNEDW